MNDFLNWLCRSGRRALKSDRTPGQQAFEGLVRHLLRNADKYAADLDAKFAAHPDTNFDVTIAVLIDPRDASTEETLH